MQVTAAVKELWIQSLLEGQREFESHFHIKGLFAPRRYPSYVYEENYKER
jgi:hypothetical protein